MSGEWIPYSTGESETAQEEKERLKRDRQWARDRADIESRGPRIKAIREDVASHGIVYLGPGTIRWIKTLPEGGIRGIISAAKDGATHGHLLYTSEMRREARREAQAAKARIKQELKEQALRKERTPEAEARPEARLIRTPRDAELAAEAWMRHFGFTDAVITPVGADEGIDVNSTRAIAQVKAYMVPVGRPDVQNLAGVAAVEEKQGVFFALSGYTPQAIQWANRAGIALFSFDLQGEPEAANEVARKIKP